MSFATIFFVKTNCKIQFHYEKKGCIIIGLATQFLNCIEHLQFTVFICQECKWTICMNYRVIIHHICNAIHLQFYQNNSFSNTMQPHYNCSHDVMLRSLIVIHLLKYDNGTMNIFGYNFFLERNIDFHHLL